MPIGYFAPATGLLWRLVEHHGIAPAAVVEGICDTAEPHLDPDRRLPVERVNALWERAADLIPDPCFGLDAARFFHPSHLGALGYAWLASPDLRTALRRMHRYVGMLSEGREVLIEEGLREVRVTTRLEPGARHQPVRAQVSLAVQTTLLRWNLGPDFVPSRVTLTQPCPGSPQRFEAAFGRLPEFDASADLIAFPTRLMDQPLASGNPQLAQLSEDYLVDYMARLERDDVAGRAQRAIADRLACGGVRIDEVARKLAMSPRTLQRRLVESGTSFRTVVETTRREIVERALRNPRLSLTEVAFCAGFSNQSTLTAAVRQWHGMAPTQYREALARGGD